MSENKLHFETLQLHVGQEEADPATGARAVPIYQTTSYVFNNSAHAAARFGLTDAGNIYGRLTNPTEDVLEKRIAALEGGVAGLAVASGAAAISYTIQALAQNGGHVVAQKTIYGGSYNLLEHTLPNFGITATFVDAHNLKEIEDAIQENTRLVYLETLGNPNSDIPDLDAIAEIAHKHGLPVVVDNTFGTPYLIRPLEHGADIVVHSATKFIGGHGTSLGGIIVDGGKFDWAASGNYPAIAAPNPSYHGISFVDAAGPAAFVTYVRAILLRDTGATISPFNAFLLLQGVETLQLHVGQEQADPATDSRAVPIYQTTSYVFRNSQHAADRFGLADAGNIYGRLTNSTQDVFEKRIAALEGGVAALATASGAAAITYTIEALAQAGDHIVAQKTIYGGSYNLLEHTLTQFGVTTTFVDAHDLEEVENAIQPNTKAVYLETLGNPNSDIPDIDAIAAIAHKHGLPLVIDNTFGTPYLIRPIEHGADIVVHSATKFIGGHGTTLGGIIVDSGKFDWKASGKYGNIAAPNPSYHGVSFADAAGPAAFVTYIRAILLRDTGATISPFNAFLLLQGTETLSLRIERHVENTKKVVEFLANHPQVEKVNHPSLPDHPDHALYEKYFPNGGASIFTFNIKGGREEAFKFIDNLKVFSLLANVADVKSLVIHPASTTHSQLTDEELAEQQIYQNTIRLSIGTEHIDDIIADLEAGFAAVRGE